MANCGVTQSCGEMESKARIIWKEIEHEMEGLQNPDKMVTLWRELDQAMLEEERQRVQLRHEQKRRRSGEDFQSL